MVAQFALSSDALPATNRLRAIRGVERLSQPYSFDLVIELVPDSLADLDAPVGKPATIQFLDALGGIQDSVHGILVTLELVDAQKDRELYLARLVPRLWWFGQNRHSRMFVDDTLREIIDKVLQSGGWGKDDYSAVLEGGPGVGVPKLEHVCQYRESDLDFLSRWMEREGIYYYFEQGKAAEKLIITDAAATHKDRKAGAREYVPRSPDGGSRVEGFHTFRRTSQAQPAGVRLADYNYMHPDLPVHHEEKKGDGQVVSLFGENLTTPEQAQWLTQLRTQELLAQKVLFRGSGHVHGIHPADQFSLQGHPRLHDAMLAVEVVHRGLDVEGRPGLREPIEEVLGDELDDGYTMEVTAIPATVQYRPPRVTPTPRITGMESAVIDGGVEDLYAQLDDHGRYNVRFKFDESDLEDGKASTRMRMVQPHGGANEGMHFPLRKGAEVMVAFVGGDPDRPIITGVSPNAHKPSLVTRANATQNVLQTGGGNKLVMEDTQGKQWIRADTPHQNSHLHLGAGDYDFDLFTEGKGRIHTGDDLKLEVLGEQTHEVTKKLTETYHDLQDTTVKERKEHVKGKVTETYDGHYEQKVTAGGMLREVTGAASETFKDGLFHQVNNGLEQWVDGGLTQNVNGGQVTFEVVGGQLNIYAQAGINLTSLGPIKQDGKTSLYSKSPAKIEETPLKGTIAKGAVFTVSPISASVIGSASNAFVSKIEVHGYKFDRTLVGNTKTIMTQEEAAIAIKKRAVEIKRAAAVKIATGALILQLTKFSIIGQ